jgi:trk system potassium uptake protein TrkA
MVKTLAPDYMVGKTLRESGVRHQHGVTIVAIKRAGEGFTYATAETVVSEGDTLIVSGKIMDTERFSEII